MLPGLAATRQVIAADFQGHGRTNDIDRPLTSAGLASDVVGLLRHLNVPQVDMFGFSVGGAVALHLAIRHPELARKVIVSSASFHPDGDRSENTEAVGEMTVDMIAGTPMEQEYLAKSPQPDRLQGLLDKLGKYDHGFPGWSDDDIEGIAAPTLITLGDCDAVRLDHAVRFLHLRGGDVNGDFAGVPGVAACGVPWYHSLLRARPDGAGSDVGRRSWMRQCPPAGPTSLRRLAAGASSRWCRGPAARRWPSAGRGTSGPPRSPRTS